jgi:phage baseplate assembly protein W
VADLRNLSDAWHFWGNDLAVSPTGDLARATSVDRSKQRVLRRLMTNPGDYITHPDYGAGLPAYIGKNVDLDAIKAVVVGQMLKEASVARTPRPVVTLRAIQNGLSARIEYVVAPEKIPAVLSFDLSQ